MPPALQFIILLVAGWVNRHQQDAIEYLKEENRVLRQQLGERRLRLTDDQRRRLAVKGKALGTDLLKETAGIPTAGRGATLSGRTSLDMVGKCARAGIELVSAISAPTTMAVDVAKRCGITLCAFVRGTRATVFSHPHRLAGED